MPSTFVDEEVNPFRPLTGWDTVTATPTLNALYERLVRSATQRSSVRESFTPTAYTGDAMWTTTTTCSEDLAGAQCNPTPVTVPPSGDTARAVSYSGTLAPNPEYVDVGCAHSTQAVSWGDEPATEESRMDEFTRQVRNVIRGFRDSEYGTYDYLRGQNHGELVMAAEATEYLKPEIWPYGTARRFEAPRMGEWERLVYAAAFMEQECRRIGESDLEALKDAEHEIRRLGYKAIEVRWPKHRVEDGRGDDSTEEYVEEPF